jgi:hypothetical protein
MDVQHLNIKFFVANPEAVNLEDFLTIFNGWIQKRATDELLVDVADYRHVYAGPGIVLIGHEANYGLDNTGNRLGLLYNRKAPLNGNPQDRLARVVRTALLACQRLEKENKLKFNGQEAQVLINDRLLAPNTAETFSALEPELKALFDKLYSGAKYTLERDPEPRERFTVNVKAEGSFNVEGLLKNLGK